MTEVTQQKFDEIINRLSDLDNKYAESVGLQSGLLSGVIDLLKALWSERSAPSAALDMPSTANTMEATSLDAKADFDRSLADQFASLQEENHKLKTVVTWLNGRADPRVPPISEQDLILARRLCCNGNCEADDLNKNPPPCASCMCETYAARELPNLKNMLAEAENAAYQRAAEAMRPFLRSLISRTEAAHLILSMVKVPQGEPTMAPDGPPLIQAAS
jgi:hypothetical protein